MGRSCTDHVIRSGSKPSLCKKLAATHKVPYALRILQHDRALETTFVQEGWQVLISVTGLYTVGHPRSKRMRATCHNSRDVSLS